jgi:hypothetical protein
MPAIPSPALFRRSPPRDPAIFAAEILDLSGLFSPSPRENSATFRRRNRFVPPMHD